MGFSLTFRRQAGAGLERASKNTRVVTMLRLLKIQATFLRLALEKAGLRGLLTSEAKVNVTNGVTQFPFFYQAPGWVLPTPSHTHQQPVGAQQTLPSPSPPGRPQFVQQPTTLGPAASLTNQKDFCFNSLPTKTAVTTLNVPNTLLFI